MKKLSVALSFLFIISCLNISAQVSYSGTIGEYPIKLLLESYALPYSPRAVYTYDRYNTPIVLSGKYANKELTLIEKNDVGEETANFVFKNFDTKENTITGYWINRKTNKQLVVTLHKQFSIDSMSDYGEGIQWDDREIIQTTSLNDRYFKVVISKSETDFYPYVSGVKILDKKTNKLLQEIEIECQLWGIYNISIGDFNFDGHDDFSIFMMSHAGPNTTSIYFLYDPLTDSFFESGFEGTSLYFDSEKKRVYEHNQCCAGTSHMNAEYKIVNNQMVLIKQTCLKYNEDTEDFDDVPCN